MGHLNLMILMSRFVFLGFGVVFIVVAFSFMKPFISYSLGEKKHRYTLLYLCTVFFHLGATSILVAKAANGQIGQQILWNSLVLLVAMSIARLLLKTCYRKEVLILWHVVFFLLDVGYIMLERLNHELASKQVIWMGIGLIGALVVPYVFSKLIHAKYKMLYLIVTLIMIGLPFVFGASKNGALNWVQIGSVSFQPSEIGKVSFVMFLAATFASFDKAPNKVKKLMRATMVLGTVLMGLVLQRDLGSALLYFLTFGVIAYVGTKSMWIPLMGTVGGILGGLTGYVLFEHVKVRVDIWLDPFADVSGKGYQVVQGLFAMGTWGFLGSGLTRGIPNKIPIVETDYIFAAIGEELGNGFAIVILLCYLGIILQGLKIALIQKDDFQTMVATGLVTLLGVQTLIIIGGVLKLVPLTGITMPFVSYGGSSMVVSFGIIGILSYLLSQGLKKTKKEDDEYEA